MQTSSPNEPTPEELVLLERCLAGEASVAEWTELKRHLGATTTANRAAVVASLIYGERAVSDDTADRLKALHRRLGLLPAAKAPAAKSSKRWPQTRFSGRMVGAFASMAILIAVLSWPAVRSFRSDQPAVTTATVAIREVRTKRGERATLDLADGTRVVLAPASRLRIPEAYATTTGPGARDLELDGEAYFVVTHDTARPFRVRTAAGIAEDLGTEFVVSAYSETRGMHVVVESGEVAVHRAAATTSTRDTLSRPLALLRAGDMARLDATGALNVQRGIDPKAWLGWLSGRLVFLDAPLPEVLATLERWYDVEFRLGDPALATLRVTMTFTKTSTDDMIEAFEPILNVRAERHGRVVTLTARNTAHSISPTHQNTGLR